MIISGRSEKEEKRRKMLYKLILVGSIALIGGLGIYFNWPVDQQHVLAQIAPELAGITGYLNSAGPITLATLHNKVVLLHFFRLGCEECQKDMPFTDQMYQKYHNFGLNVIGVHSAQFDYEHSTENVKNFLHNYGVKFPVVLDPQKSTFNEYNDMAWPKDVIVGKDGHIVYSHIGSGDDYDRELAIRTALAMRNY